MIFFITLITILSTIVLFCSCLAYAFGNYLLYDWTNWAGWCGIMIVIFVIIGTTIIKTLEAFASVILKKFSFFNKRSEADAKEWLNHERRQFLQYSMNIGLIVASSSLAVHGLSNGLSLPEVKEIDIEIENLPSDLEGLSIVQITDLHISSAIRRNWVQNLVERVNVLDPDIIAFTGDIADNVYAEISYDAAPLAGLTARLGKFFVTGNHEYMHGVEEWIQEMENMDFTVLLNSHRLIPHGCSLILIGGVADYSAPSHSSHASSPVEAMGDGFKADVKILLAHQPLSVYEAARAGFDLQLSGHTHGGQFGLGSWLRSFVQPFQSGLYKYKNTQLYVSNGAGYVGPPVRLGAPSEISLLKLTDAGRGSIFLKSGRSNSGREN